MEVINKNGALLSNAEVYKLLKEIKEKEKLKYLKNLATVSYEAIKYLEESPAAHQNEESIRHYLETIKDHGFQLTKAEKLQILNQRPTTVVEFQLLIEECEERFSEEAINSILDIVQRTLPTHDPDLEMEECTDADGDY